MKEHSLVCIPRSSNSSENNFLLLHVLSWNPKSHLRFHSWISSLSLFQVYEYTELYMDRSVFMIVNKIPPIHLYTYPQTCVTQYTSTCEAAKLFNLCVKRLLPLLYKIVMLIRPFHSIRVKLLTSTNKSVQAYKQWYTKCKHNINIQTYNIKNVQIYANIRTHRKCQQNYYSVHIRL